MTKLLEKVGLYNLAFEKLPTFPHLLIEFLSTFSLRTHHIDKDNPLNSMKFRLGMKDRFMTTIEFENLFSFTNGGHNQSSNTWIPHNFWLTHTKLNTKAFEANLLVTCDKC